MMRLAVPISIALVLGGIQGASAGGAPSPMPFDWSGFYAGANGGYAWGNAPSHYDDPFGPTIFGSTPIATMHASGGYGGVQLGLNHLFASDIVLGVEGDISFGDISDTIPDDAGGAPNTVTSRTDMGGTLRGRIGKAFGHTLLYGTGGLSWAHVTITATDGPLSDNATLFGWNIGLGVEHALTETVSVKLEYLYTDFGSHSWFAGQPWQSTGTSTSNAIRAGINVHF